MTKSLSKNIPIRKPLTRISKKKEKRIDHNKCANCFKLNIH